MPNQIAGRPTARPRGRRPLVRCVAHVPSLTDVLFEAWLAGDAAADADCSGGTPDASDVDVFFAQWFAWGY